MYRGELVEAEDSWNVQLKNVTATSKVRTHRFMPYTESLVSSAQQVNMGINAAGRQEFPPGAHLCSWE